jgi:hypothetical protein
MIYTELGDTLLALVESVSAPSGSGLVVTNVEMEIPLEVFSGMEHGRLVFYGSPPHTVWKTGVLPVVHKGTLHVTLVEDDPDGSMATVGKGTHVDR